MTKAAFLGILASFAAAASTLPRLPRSSRSRIPVHHGQRHWPDAAEHARL